MRRRSAALLDAIEIELERSAAARAAGTASTDGDPVWRTAAACRTATAVHFFPPNHHEHKAEKDRREAAARAVCRRCPVRARCLEHALGAPERHGIWGGLNELERRRLRDRRTRAAAAPPN